jgi:hypothetical protein
MTPPNHVRTMPCQRKRRLWIALFVVGGAALLAVAVFVSCVGDFHSMQQARREFLSSRPGRYDSTQFITRGVTHGMSVEEVDRMMAGASECSDLAYMTRAGEFLKMYSFRYGPPWKNPFTGQTKYLYQEWFWVYFDEQKRAVRLERVDNGEPDLWYNFTVSCDLSERDSASQSDG